jgi:hypothetical protein
LPPRLETDQEKAVKTLQFNGFEAELRTIHFVVKAFGPGGAAQAPVEVVDPAVERADQRALAMPLRPVDHPRAAVAAKIVKGAHDPVAAAHDQGPLAQKIKSQPIAGSGDIVLMANDLPVGEE